MAFPLTGADGGGYKLDGEKKWNNLREEVEAWSERAFWEKKKLCSASFHTSLEFFFNKNEMNFMFDLNKIKNEVWWWMRKKVLIK